MTYSHTQHAPMHYILVAVALLLFLIAGIGQGIPSLFFLFLILGSLTLVLSYSFRSLTVSDQGDHLLIQYGPLPLFKKSFRYADITSATAGQISLIDGWGIHFVPGRGWTYNLWGLGCVILTVNNKTVRIGSDDADNLATFIDDKIKTATPSA